jgi:hypothetical protein
MTAGNRIPGLSQADLVALDAIAACQVETRKALQELARTIALERGVELPEPQSDRPQPKKRSCRRTNITSRLATLLSDRERWHGQAWAAARVRFLTVAPGALLEPNSCQLGARRPSRRPSPRRVLRLVVGSAILADRRRLPLEGNAPASGGGEGRRLR